jgi:hypothetical protein
MVQFTLIYKIWSQNGYIFVERNKQKSCKIIRSNSQNLYQIDPTKALSWRVRFKFDCEPD